MKLIHHYIFIIFVSILCMTACQEDEELLMEDVTPVVPVEPVNPDTPASRATSYSKGLIQNADGTWSPTQRVPLVGMGRIVDDYANGLIAVGTGNNSIGNITDLDINNCAEFGAGLANVQAIGNQIASVRDLHHVYKGGTKVGFVFKATQNNLLTVDLLKNFWLQTFLTEYDGSETKECDHSVGDGSGGLLGLDLISVGSDDGLKEISFVTSRDFNEVKFGISGVNIDALGKAGIQVYYAFVGDNPIKPAVSGSAYYPNAHIHKGTGWVGGLTGTSNIVDGDITNNAFYSILGALVQPHVTVDFGKEIPVGSEVGFDITFGDVLSLDIGGTIILETYDANDVKQDHISVTKVLGLNLAKGAHRHISLITTKPCSQVYIMFAGLNVKLGATMVYYAYSRDKVEIDGSSVFSMPPKVTVQGNSFTLPAPQGGSTSWFITNRVAESTPSLKAVGNRQRIVGMNKNGEYELSGTFVPHANEFVDSEPIHVNFRLNRDAKEPVEQIIGTAYEASVENCNKGGTLIDIFGIEKEIPNIVDDSPFTYATFSNVLDLAKNQGIVAVKANSKKINAAGKTVRAGFTLQTTFDFLSLDVLKFFQIKLYDGETLVAKSYADGSDSKFNSVGLNLIGTKSDKFRVFVETDKPFDRIELWNAGVLGLNLKGRRIYNAFCEEATPELAKTSLGIEDAGLEFVTPLAFGAKINYNECYVGALATVGGTFANLGKLIDNSKLSSSLIASTTVAGASQIAVKFDEIQADPTHKHRVGMIIDLVDGLTLEALKGDVFKVYHQGKELIKKSFGELLQLKIGANNGLTYLETEMDQPFDEVRYQSAGVAEVFRCPQPRGVFLRMDNDGNGIPDGSDGDDTKPDPETPAETVEATIAPHDICENDELTLTLTKGYDATAIYTIICYNQSTNKRQDLYNQKPSSSQTFTLKGLDSGQYAFYVMKDDNTATCSQEVNADVHPLQTTWKAHTVDQDWNRWDNWDKGTPWHCSNVIIPSSCDRYPSLSSGGNYYCKNIHFGTTGELIGAQNLQYGGKVWVELSAPVGHDYLIAAPLQEMVTGDFFVPLKWAGNHTKEQLFTNLTAASSPASRLSPRVYQRFWSSDVNGKILTNGVLEDQPIETEQGVICAETGWTKSFNAVAEKCLPGHGFTLRTEKEGLSTNLINFRFPKMHAEYEYFNSSGQSTGAKESVVRTLDKIGHFAFEALKKDGQYAVTLRNNVADKTIFVAGNPFMAHLSIEKFIQANKATIQAVKINDGSTNHTVSYNESSNLFEYTDENITHISPKQGFYVVAKSAAQTLNLIFTDEMQDNMPSYAPFSQRHTMKNLSRGGMNTSAVTDESSLYLTAFSAEQSSSCLLMLSPSSRSEQKNTDSDLLYDTEYPPTASVFTVGNGKALDIQHITGENKIPVGFRMGKEGLVELYIKHAVHSEWRKWKLEDRATGKSYSLAQEDTYIKLGVLRTELGRFYLVKQK